MDSHRFEHLEDDALMTLHSILSMQFSFHQERFNKVQAQHEAVLAELSERGLLSEDEHG